MKRFSTATWNGPGLTGHGLLASESKEINANSFTFDSRFKHGSGTNPEELLAAAYASDFAMKLSFVLGEAGFVPEDLEITCYIALENGAITSAHITVMAGNAEIPTIIWDESLRETEKNTPVGKTLNIPVSIERLP